MVGGGGRVLLCAQRLYYVGDQLDCLPPNGLNHYLPLNKTGAHSTDERFRATMALLFDCRMSLICSSVVHQESFKNLFKQQIYIM